MLEVMTDCCLVYRGFTIMVVILLVIVSFIALIQSQIK